MSTQAKVLLISTAIPLYTQMTTLHAPEPWSVGLFDCFSDCGRCCISCLCPCVTFGQVSEIIDKGSSYCWVNGGLYFLVNALVGLGCLCSCIYRAKMRKMFHLQGNGGKDCLIHLCCEPCALTQMYRQLQNKGFDGSVEQQTTPPVMQAGMTR